MVIPSFYEIKRGGGGAFFFQFVFGLLYSRIYVRLVEDSEDIFRCVKVLSHSKLPIV